MSQESLVERMEDLDTNSVEEPNEVAREVVAHSFVEKMLIEMLKDVRKARKGYWENEIHQFLNKKKPVVKSISSEDIIKKLKQSIVAREYELNITDLPVTTGLGQIKQELQRLITQYKDLNHRTLSTLHQIGKYLSLAKEQCGWGKTTFKDFKKQLNIPWSVDFIRFVIGFYDFSQKYTRLCWCGISPDFVKRYFRKIKEYISQNEEEKVFWSKT